MGVTDILQRVDRDGDGSLDKGELETYYAHDHDASWARELPDTLPHGMSPQDRRVAVKELVDGPAGDVLAYHDLDADGIITRSELLNSTLQWNVLYDRLSRLQALNPNHHDSAEDARIIELDFLEKFAAFGEDSGIVDALADLRQRQVPPLIQLVAYAPN